MAMMWGILVLALSATSVTIRAQLENGVDAGFNIGFSDDGAEFNSYIEASPCYGENCQYETSSEYPVQEPQDYEYPVQEPQEDEYPVQEQQDDEYGSHFPDQPATPEPVYPEHPVFPDPVFPQPDSSDSSMQERNICKNLALAGEIIESLHPDIKFVKHGVIERLIDYSAYYATMESDSCDPAVKLLDIIIMSASELRQTFLKESDTCYYETTSESEYTTSSYDQMESTGKPYPEVTSSATEEYEPCSDEPIYTTAGYETKPCTKKPIYKPSAEEPIYEPCKPDEYCSEWPASDYIQTEEIIAEDYEYNSVYPPFVGSIRGIPGVHYPNYTEVPITSFSCADKKYIPGFYADLETGCQVFHVCYEHRRESFLCPVGTIFNQPILACDYWYSSNCSFAPECYDVNIKTADIAEPDVEELPEEDIEELAPFLPVKAKVTVFTETPVRGKIIPEKPVVQEFVPEIFEVPSKPEFYDKPSAVQVKLHVPKFPGLKPKMVKSVSTFKAKKVAGKVLLAKSKVPVISKVKFAAAMPVVAKAKIFGAGNVAVGKVAAAKVVPILAKTKLVASKTAAVKLAAPVVAKAKLAAAGKTKLVAGKTVAVKAAIPLVATAKLAAGVKVAAPVSAKVAVSKVTVPAKVIASKKIFAKAAAPVAAKIVAAAGTKVAAKATPILKGKIIAASLPFAKSALLKASLPAAKIVPVMSAKLASVPVVKGKLLALPLTKSKFVAAPMVKAKMIKAAAISPLTKKALTLGYMKLLKAKKLALVG